MKKFLELLLICTPIGNRLVDDANRDQTEQNGQNILF